MDLTAHTLTSLDTAFVRAAWISCATTTMGAERIADLPALEGPAAVRKVYAAILEWHLLVDERRAPALSGASDVRSRVAGARKGEVLDASDLLLVSTALDVLDRAARRLLNDDEIPVVAQIASVIGFDVAVLDELSQAFQVDGRLSAKRYPEIGELRSRVVSLHTQLRSTLESMAKGAELSDDLQDTFWTVRNDRYVLPLKPHAKNKGVVHGTSGSGKTVFVEPHEILELNNRLRLTEGELAAAERRIFMALSRLVGANAEEILRSLEGLVQLDLIASRAELASRMKALPVQVQREGRISLSAARHPVLVLRGLTVVPHDLDLSAEHPALVLTGPNTGGKTIALKTLGLCGWMVRHGLALPAGPDGRFDWFDRIHADVGDGQTVQDDLSSFSAQLVAVREMLATAGPHVLILLDELASGTDPQQGAALAIAVLEELVVRGCRIVTTTHYPPLKGLAATDHRFSVAAMEVLEGKPTYRLLPGMTGESHALSTAERLGLPEGVMARARALWKDGDHGVAETLEALEQQRADLERRERELEERLFAARAQEVELAARNERLRTRSEALEKKAAEAFVERLKKAEKAVGAVVAQLQASPSHKGVKAAQSTLEAFANLVPGQEPPRPPAAPAEVVYEVGDQVRHSSLGTGIIEEIGKTIRVRGGAVTFNAKPADLTLLTARPVAVARPAIRNVERSAPIDLTQALRLPNNTLDLRGMRVDEAIDAVDIGLSKAISNGIEVVFVLHGHGTGALKTAVREALQSHSAVAVCRPANADQGGDAYTIAAVR